MRLKFKLYNKLPYAGLQTYRQLVLESAPVKQNDSKRVCFSLSLFECCPLSFGRHSAICSCCRRKLGFFKCIMNAQPSGAGAVEKEGLLLFAISGTPESLHRAKCYRFAKRCCNFLTLSHLTRQHLHGEWKMKNMVSLSSVQGVHLSWILTDFTFTNTSTIGEHNISFRN